MDGLIIVDKPIGKTSFDMVHEIRKKYNIQKVGHIGTLDPLATGVLPILIGQATKLSDYLMEHDKEYIATLKLGQATETGDQEGKIIEEKEVPNLGKIDIQRILNENFIGEQMQVPPMYSAIKVNGKKLYELARKGEKIDVAPRKINIFEIEYLEKDVTMNDSKNLLLDEEENEESNKMANLEMIKKEGTTKNTITFRVVCSKGTYIRVLCEDIAKKIGTCGYMESLRRTRVGDFKIEETGKFIDLKDLLKVPNVNIENNDMKKLLNGVPIEINNTEISKNENKNDDEHKMEKINKNETLYLVNIYNNEKFVGIGEIKNNFLKRKILV